jgi:hypothetical protein
LNTPYENCTCTTRTIDTTPCPRTQQMQVCGRYSVVLSSYCREKKRIAFFSLTLFVFQKIFSIQTADLTHTHFIHSIPLNLPCTFPCNLLTSSSTSSPSRPLPLVLSLSSSPSRPPLILTTHITSLHSHHFTPLTSPHSTHFTPLTSLHSTHFTPLTSLRSLHSTHLTSLLTTSLLTINQSSNQSITCYHTHINQHSPLQSDF